MTQKIISNLGSISNLEEILVNNGTKNLLLVTGKRSFSLSGAELSMKSIFDRFNVTRFQDFEVNPKYEDALKGVKIAREREIDTVVSVGGGSVIDIAKLILAFIEPNQNLKAILDGKSKPLDPSIPHFSVPTTAGTGSESTHFAVVYFNKAKYSVAASFLTPDVAILDGELIKSNSSNQKAYNGLDALAQAIESHWATGSTDESRYYSRKAIPVLFNYLPEIVSGKADSNVHQNLICAANLAGKAINISKTTAPHAFSYSFTSKFGIPHGQAVWLTLPKIFKIHSNTLEGDNLNVASFSQFNKSVKEIIRILNLGETDLVTKLQNYINELGLEYCMEKLGATSKLDREKIAKDVNLERLRNNPVCLSEENIRVIFNL